MKIHRKAGKSALSINHLIQQAVYGGSQKKPGVYWYVAPTYSQGKEIVWRDPEMLSKYLPGEIVVKKNDSELLVDFLYGSSMVVKGADKPDSLRGPNPKGVILDEAYMMKPAVWNEIILPIAMANPDMWVWIIGTPKPTGKYWRDIYADFERRMNAGDPNFFCMTLDVESSGILGTEQIAQARSTMTQAGFDQEFMCRESDDGGVVFRGIQDIIFGPYLEPQENRGSDKIATYEWGIDLAKLVDWTVVSGINRYNHRLEVFDRYNQIDYNLQKARIEALYRRHGKGRAKVDATGVGQPIIDDLDARGMFIEPVMFTSATKSNLVTNLAIGIEQRKLQIPEIPELIEELNLFGYEVTKSGLIRYGAPEGYHDDCVMSLALAWWDVGTKLGAIPSRASAMLSTKTLIKKTGYDSE